MLFVKQHEKGYIVCIAEGYLMPGNLMKNGVRHESVYNWRDWLFGGGPD